MLLRFAWRNVWRNKTRSGLITGSVAVGLMSGIFLSGLYQGMMAGRRRDVIQRETSHLQLHHPLFRSDTEGGYSITGPDRIDSVIRRLIPGAQVSARMVVSAMIASSTGTSGVTAFGVVPEQEDKVTQLESWLTAGGFGDDRKIHSVIIGRKLAQKIGVHVGSKIILTFPDCDNTIVAGAFRVTGIYETRNSTIDKTRVYVRFGDLEKLYGSTDTCQEIAVLLPHDELMETTRIQLTGTFPKLHVETWKELAPEVAVMIETTDDYSIIFLTIVMLTLLFGIINTMLMAVLERTREIGMLVALGMSRRRIFQLILLETVLLTFSGAPIGLFMVWALIRRWFESGLDISGMAGSTMSGYGFSTMIYPEFPTSSLPQVLLIVSATALLASVLPAVRSAGLQPADALRS